jgi:hypothetical protein
MLLFGFGSDFSSQALDERKVVVEILRSQGESVFTLPLNWPRDSVWFNEYGMSVYDENDISRLGHCAYLGGAQVRLSNSLLLSSDIGLTQQELTAEKLGYSRFMSVEPHRMYAELEIVNKSESFRKWKDSSIGHIDFLFAHVDGYLLGYNSPHCALQTRSIANANGLEPVLVDSSDAMCYGLGFIVGEHNIYVDERASSTILTLRNMGKNVYTVPSLHANNSHSGALHCLYKEIPSSVEIHSDKPSCLCYEVMGENDETYYIPRFFERDVI